MPVRWSIEDGLLRLVSDEEASFSEWCDAIDAATESQWFRPGTAVCHDARRMRRVPTGDEAQQRINVLMAHAGAAGVRRWATVVDGTAILGVGRMGERLASQVGVSLRVFTDLEKAESWARTGS